MSKKFFNLYLIFLYLFLFLTVNSQDNYYSFLSEKEEILENSQILEQKQIDNAIYIIRNYEGDKNLDIENNLPNFINNPKKSLKKHFRFISIDKKTKRFSMIINSDNYYCIEDKDNHKRIGITNQRGDLGFYSQIDYNTKIPEDNSLWNIFPIIKEEKKGKEITKKVYYYLKNKGNGKFLTYSDDKKKLKCEFDNEKKLSNKNYFILNKMYREKNPNESSEILEKEPIDVLIKYIDLSDPNLKREGISQIKKDEENGEIKYVIRSIIKNIPWIRKIFILMPNEKIKYFKDPEEINDKIIYVKDKDILGFDSASSPAFQFNLWKMKEFGMSENFILMDDDYFIGKPLEKSNFFYEEDGKVYPALITGDYYEMSKAALETAIRPLIAKINNIGAHTPNGFSIMQKSSLLFLYDIFGNDDTRQGQPLIEASFSHNAISVKQSDIKEIYDLIVKLYPYADETLKAKIRHIRSLQPQTIFLSYPKNKYDRRVKIVSSKFYDLTQFKGKIESHLYVINTSDKKYNQNYYVNEIKKLQELYPEKTIYERDENDNKKEKLNTQNKENTANKNPKLDEKKEEKKEEKKDVSSEILNEDVVKYLNNILNEKEEYKNELNGIKNKIEFLLQEYKDSKKEIENLIHNYNNIMKNNITSYENQNKSKNSSKFLFIEILIVIVFLFYLFKYLYNKSSFNDSKNNETNYSDLDGFGYINNDMELSSKSSKLLL